MMKIIHTMVSRLYPVVLGAGIAYILFQPNSRFFLNPFYWIALLISAFLVAFRQRKNPVKPPRSQDERYVQKSNQLLTYWTLTALTIATWLLVMVANQGTNVIPISYFAYGVVAYVAGWIVIELYIHFVP